MTFKERLYQRNAALVAHYQAGDTIAQCSRRFSLSRQRLVQVLKHAGVWKPRMKTDRVKFVGVNVSARTKKALSKEAKRHGLSVSRFTAEVLDKLTKNAE